MDGDFTEEQRENSEPRLANLKPFQPGQCGNPKGRPKGSISITRHVREALAKNEVVTINPDGSVTRIPLPEGVTLSDALASVMVKCALEGDFRFAKEIWDRTDGKVPDKIEADVQHSSPNNVLDALKAKVGEDPERRIALAQMLDELSQESDEQADESA